MSDLEITADEIPPERVHMLVKCIKRQMSNSSQVTKCHHTPTEFSCDSCFMDLPLDPSMTSYARPTSFECHTDANHELYLADLCLLS